MVIDHVSQSWDDPPSTHHTSQESHKISVILILLETESNAPKADPPVNSSRTKTCKKIGFHYFGIATLRCLEKTTTYILQKWWAMMVIFIACKKVKQKSSKNLPTGIPMVALLAWIFCSVGFLEMLSSIEKLQCRNFQPCLFEPLKIRPNPIGWLEFLDCKNQRL